MVDDYYKKVFSKNLKYYMSINDKEQIDLINDLGFNKSSVSTWCNGTRLPRMDKVEKLAQYFNINRSDLIEEKEKKETNPSSIHEKQKEHELLEIYRKLSNENKYKTTQYSKGLLSLQEMDSELMVNAAHARTDIEVTEEMRKHDDDLMDGEW